MTIIFVAQSEPQRNTMNCFGIIRFETTSMAKRATNVAEIPAGSPAFWTAAAEMRPPGATRTERHRPDAMLQGWPRHDGWAPSGECPARSLRGGRRRAFGHRSDPVPARFDLDRRCGDHDLKDRPVSARRRAWPSMTRF